MSLDLLGSKWDVNPPCPKVASTITILLKQKYPGSTYLPSWSAKRSSSQWRSGSPLATVSTRNKGCYFE